MSREKRKRVIKALRTSYILITMLILMSVVVYADSNIEVIEQDSSREVRQVTLDQYNKMQRIKESKNHLVNNISEDDGWMLNTKELIKNEIKKGVQSLEDIVNISINIDNNDADKVVDMVFDTYFEFLYDKPEISYLLNNGVGASYYIDNNKLEVSLYLHYIDIKENLPVIKKNFDNKLQEIKEHYLDGVTNKAQLLYIIHDYLLDNTSYDYDNYLDGIIPDISYNAYGAIVKGVAVCDGYSKAAKALMNLVGIESGIIRSYEMNHSWNYVKVDNEYYHMDVTWDDPVPETNRIRYNYFLIPDNEMSKDHIWSKTQYPMCNGNKFTEIRNMYNIARIDDRLYYSDGQNIYSYDLYGKDKIIEVKSTSGDNLVSYKKSLYYSKYNIITGGYSICKYNIVTKNEEIIHDKLDYIIDMYIKSGVLYVTEVYTGNIIEIELNEKEDINDDGVVNIYDLSKLALRYGEINGASNWNSKYDLNLDEIIDLYDLVLISKKV